MRLGWGRCRKASSSAGLARTLGRIESGDRGATATEYAILVGFIAIAIVFGIGAFGTQLNAFYIELRDALVAALS